MDQKELDDYKQENNVTGGVVIVYGNEIQGWKIELGAASCWRPDCVAYDEQGNSWLASGGNDYSGAVSWVSLDNKK